MADFFGDNTNNDFFGTNAADLMQGNGGDDTLTGNGGLDLMFGGVGNDTFRYNAGEDGPDGETADGGLGHDRLFFTGGGTFDLREMDFLFIEEIEFDFVSPVAKNVYIGSVEMDGPGELASNLTVDGGIGSPDTLRIYVNQNVTTVDISNWIFTDWDPTDQISIEGDTLADSLTGSNQSEALIGGAAGNDYLRGLDGDDFIYGGANDDRIEGGNDEDRLFGGGGEDSINGDNGNDTLNGGEGNDLLYGGGGIDTVRGDDGNDIIFILGGGGSDSVDGGLDTDTLDTFNATFSGSTFDFLAGTMPGGHGLAGIEVFHDSNTGGNTIVSQGTGGTYYGNGGGDTFVAADGNETAYGGAGNDTLDLRAGNFPYVFNLATGVGSYSGERFEGFETVLFGNGNDNLTGTADADTAFGGGGNDWFTPGTGNNSIDGDGGIDMISYVDSVGGITANLATGIIQRGAFTDTVTEVENITGSATGGDFITGDINANRIRGLGNYDWMVASGGGDTFEGGSGRDMVSYVNAAGGVTVNLGTGQGTGGQAAGDTYVDVERVTGSVFADLFYGSNGQDDFRGLGGDDWFVGSGGGRDRYDGGTSEDTVAYSDSASGVTASLLLGRGTGGDAAQDLYTSIENLTGSSGNDTLTGDNNANVLRGLFGRDLLVGNGGIDRLQGGGGNDSLDGGTGWDYAIFSANRADYAISTVAGVTTVDFLGAGGDGIDTVRNIEVLRFADLDVFL